MTDDWDALMRRGDWAAAWTLGDAAVGDPAAPRHVGPRHRQVLWDGAPLAGRRVLVRCYHGLGDTLQCARFAPWLAGTAAGVTWWAQPRLIPLLRTVPGMGRLLPLHDGDPGVARDVDIESMELAHAFRVTPATLPARVPYVRVPAVPLPGAAGLRCGLVWRAGGWDAARSADPTDLEPLGRVPGVTWFSFQRGDDGGRPPWLRDPGTGDDVVAEAGAMRSLDVLVTVDTMAAHLAGALGVTTWTLLAHRADWRWLEDRDDSPWYPTMRLWRQRRAGDWRDVIDRVAGALARTAAVKRAGG